MLRAALQATGRLRRSAACLGQPACMSSYCAQFGPDRHLCDRVRASDLRICAGQRVVVASRPIRRIPLRRLADRVKRGLTCENTAREFALAPPASRSRADISRTGV
jgi:hypothetical protein